MEMISEQRIPASRDAVWAALNNTEILKQAMPGCESFDAIEENKFEAKLTAKVGPVKAKFKFQVELSEINAPNGYTILGEGQGGVAGFAKGSAKVDLTEDGDETILAYNVQASVGGKLAQLGARLIDGTAKKMADDFFGNFTDILSGSLESSD
jgi:carbon monoxide dehydrogenase subunit G|tara:strand:+ start:8495 stop:8953 length:459 start_codon:yes stop_codon:yes gene_type:complete